jgi:hypothetical protein
MKRHRSRDGRKWSERTVRLRSATLTTFDGPGDEVTVVVHGKRAAVATVTRHHGRTPAKGGQ